MKFSKIFNNIELDIDMNVFYQSTLNYTKGSSPPPINLERNNLKLNEIAKIQNIMPWNDFDNIYPNLIYAIVNCDPPHYVLKANYKWFTEFGYTPADLGKIELLNNLVTENHGPKSCTQNLRKTNLLRTFSNDLLNFVCNQTVFELHSKKDNSIGLYSLYSFPIMIIKNINDNNNSTTTTVTPFTSTFTITSTNTADIFRTTSVDKLK